MKAGDKVRFTTDSAGEVFTVKAVSTDGEMVLFDEIGLWFYPDNVVIVNAALDLLLTQQLNFLGL